MTRQIPDDEYLKFLLQILNMDELKDVCRSHEIKGFSRYKRSDLIDFIIDSLAEEEMAEYIKENELKILSKPIELGIDKITGKDRESITNIKIVNPVTNEIEIKFRGFNWETSCMLSITNDNIKNPERYCECRIGSDGGFCPHFWVGFIFSLKQGYFKLKDWTLTKLPKDLNKKIEKIKISEGSTSGEEELRIFDESSQDSKLMKFLNARVTVYDGIIEDLKFHEDDYQGNITEYYVANLKEGKIGPQIKKKSDYDESILEDFDVISARISKSKHDDVNLKVGDIITLNGGLNKDNFEGFILKRVTKILKK